MKKMSEKRVSARDIVERRRQKAKSAAWRLSFSQNQEYASKLEASQPRSTILDMDLSKYSHLQGLTTSSYAGDHSKRLRTMTKMMQLCAQVMS